MTRPLPDDEPPAAEPPARSALVPLPTRPRRQSLRRLTEPRGWVAPHLVNAGWQRVLWSVVVEAVVLAMSLGADLVFIKTTLDPLIGQDEILSWLVAVALGVLSAVLPLHAGAHARTFRAVGHGWVQALGLTVTWLLLGAGLFWLRWAAADLNPGDLIADPDAIDRATSAHHVMAVVLATLYLATGAAAAVGGYRLTNPEASALRMARAALRRVEAALGPAEAAYARLLDAVAARTADMTDADPAAETARQLRRAVADHIRAVARVRIAQHLADPSATGGALPQP
ncbi:hypothetical protein [Pseudonocardia xishanensis]|uniref:Uncharacterized protein n=1 Tax=Pseudonocardia xishanensis TaxID=630995 RepID=A0ABP8RCD7_9PSEU